MIKIGTVLAAGTVLVSGTVTAISRTHVTLQTPKGVVTLTHAQVERLLDDQRSLSQA